MTRFLQMAFFAVIVRPILMIILGVHVRRRELLPADGPAVLIANHNSHLDTLTLMALYPLRDLHKIRPVAAMDYFMTKPLMRWIACDLIGIIPVDRKTGVKEGGNPLEGALTALDQGHILVLFPEGSRGAPEELTTFKKGIAHLSAARPDVPVTPIFTHGLGKSLPKGSMVLVPFNCDVFVGPALTYPGTIDGFMTDMTEAMEALAAEGEFPAWK